MDISNIASASAFNDVTPPQITDIQTKPSARTATITLVTNESATSKVDYGITTNYDSSVEDLTPTQSHSITLHLEPETTYYYKITSKDAANNPVESTRDFTTTAGLPIPGIIQTEDYKAGEGVGYYDVTAGNEGGQYRNDDVDIQATTDMLVEDIMLSG